MIGTPKKYARRVKRLLHSYLPEHRSFNEAFPLPVSLKRMIIRIDEDDRRNAGGYCHLQKKWVLASLVVQKNIQRSVEIGVYLGSSLLATAAAMKHTGGVAVGIDPFDGHIWEQKEGIEIMERVLGSNWRADVATLDWEGFYREVTGRMSDYGLKEYCQILRGLSHELDHQVETGIGLLHIDGNHDYDAVALDVQKYVPKMVPGGLVVFDDVGWPGVAPHYEQAKRVMDTVFETPGYGVLRMRS